MKNVLRRAAGMAARGRRLAALLCFGIAGLAQAQSGTAVEYYYSAWDYYFVTANPDEIALLDGGAFNGNWVRTGEAFPVGTQAGGGFVETCRFFSTSFAPKSSHFYTPFAAECASVRISPDWQFENIAFYVRLTDVDGSCPAGTTPLYRLYNNGMGGAPNHRYTVRRTTVDLMRARGWTSEGNGPDVIFACVPSAPGSAAKGLWAGTTSANETALAIVLDDGTFYLLYAYPGRTTDAAVVQGTASTIGGQFASTDARSYPIATANETSGFETPATVGGTYSAQGTLQLDFADLLGTRTLAAVYVSGSDQPASLAAAAGTYTGFSGHADGRVPATFTFTAAGTLTGSNSACGFTGTITPHAALAVFDWTVRQTSGSCIFGAGPISGVLYFDAATRQVHGFAPFAGRGDLYYLIGTKP